MNDEWKLMREGTVQAMVRASFVIGVILGMAIGFGIARIWN